MDQPFSTIAIALAAVEVLTHSSNSIFVALRRPLEFKMSPP